MPLRVPDTTSTRTGQWAFTVVWDRMVRRVERGAAVIDLDRPPGHPASCETDCCASRQREGRVKAEQIALEQGQ